MTQETAYSIVVLGGTSAIALAYARRRIETLSRRESGVRIMLVGRDQTRLDAEAADLTVRGAVVRAIMSDLSNCDGLPEIFLAEYRVDELVIAYGALTDQRKAQQDSLYLSEQIMINFSSAACWLEKFARVFAAQGYGKVAVIGSVAGDRGRQSNYVYGAAKAGLERFVQGLQHRFAATKSITFTLVKPGFVDTPMTAGITPKGALWSTPDRVAVDMEKAVLRGKATVYTPWFWRWIMLIIVLVPNFVFHRTKL